MRDFASNVIPISPLDLKIDLKRLSFDTPYPDLQQKVFVASLANGFGHHADKAILESLQTAPATAVVAWAVTHLVIAFDKTGEPPFSVNFLVSVGGA